MSTLEELRARLELLNQEINNLNESINTNSTSLNTRIDRFSTASREFDEDVEKYNTNLNKYINNHQGFSEKVERFEQKVNVYNENVTRLQNDYEQWRNDINLHENRVDRLNNKIDTYNQLLASPNPNIDYLQQLRNEIESERNKIQRASEELQLRTNQLSSRDEQLKNERNILEREEQDLLAEEEVIIREGERLEEWKNSIESRREELEQETQALIKLQNDIDSLNNTLNQKLLERQAVQLKIENFSNNFTVSRGQLTFDAEGTEGGRYHSRKPHVPSNNSGVTIGRGYDMKLRSANEIITHLTSAGLTSEEATAYSKAAKLKGEEAKKFIEINAASLIEISPRQQKVLFETIYPFYERDVIRICNKPDVVEKYGETDWEALNIGIKEVVIDLRFRGDYSGKTRKFLQSHIANNNLSKFTEAISNYDNWTKVPRARFDARVKYLRNLSKLIPKTQFLDSLYINDVGKISGGITGHINQARIPKLIPTIVKEFRPTTRLINFKKIKVINSVDKYSHFKEILINRR